MRVSNPTITTLTVTWSPADGNVQGYKVVYVPTDGGLEIVVRTDPNLSFSGVLRHELESVPEALSVSLGLE